MQHFSDRLTQNVLAVGAPVAIGLDPHLHLFPEFLRVRFHEKNGEAFRHRASLEIVEFNVMVLEALQGKVAAIKPQFAFYEKLGAIGWTALEETCSIARELGYLIIADAKRGDIASTGEAYAEAILSPDGPLQCDAVTLNPWMGLDTLAPFLRYSKEFGKGVFALLRTTNPESGFLQNYGAQQGIAPVAEHLAKGLHRLGQDYVGEQQFSAVGAVVGAFAEEEAQQYRELMPNAWFLVPGVGAQGASPRQALAGQRADGLGALVVSSRSLLYPKGEKGAYDQSKQGVQDFVSQAVAELTEQLKLEKIG